MSADLSASADILTAARPKYPYPGLRPFQIDEWPIFFGRERMVDEVIERLAAHHLVLIHGASGCGKSSLVRAGVLPTLAGQHLRAGAPWQLCMMRPSNGPLWNLASEFARLERGREDITLAGDIMRHVSRREVTLSSVVSSLRGLKGHRVCLLVDQFEELFRFEKETSREEAELFVDLLVRSNVEGTCKHADGMNPDDQAGVHVVVTMRSEFLGECARFNGLAEAINQTQFLVPRMDRDSLMRAIQRPAQLYGGEVSVDLAERLVADVARGEDELPLIQHGLMYLWNEAARARPGGKIVLDAAPLEAAGGLAALLSNHADAVVNESAPDLERRCAVERLFRALTNLNAEGQAVRRPQAFRNLVAVTEIAEPKLRDMIEALRRDGVSFLLPHPREPIADGTMIDIAHESLIRQWKTLSNWVEKEARAARDWQYLVQAAERQRRLSGAALRNAVKDYDDIKPTAAWADRYGGGFEIVSSMINAGRALRRANFRLAAGAIAGVLAVVVFSVLLTFERQRIELKQQSAVVGVTVASAQKLLDQISTSLESGDISSKGAKDMLRVATEILQRVQTVETTPETIALLANLKWTAADVYSSLGEVTQAYDSAKAARDLVEPLYASDPNNPLVLQLLYGSVWRMGDAVSEGNFDSATQQKALQLYLEAEQFARRLSDMAPEDGARQHDVAFALWKIGDVRQVLSDWDGAIAAYRAALTIIQKLVVSEPDNEVWQRDLATAESRLGQALSGQKDFDAAMRQLQAALEIRTKLAAAHPASGFLHADVAKSRRDIARLYVLRGDLDAAAAEYQRAIGIVSALLVQDPTNANWTNLLAPFYAQYATLLQQRGDLGGALDQYRKAYAIRRELALRDPTVPARQYALATAGMAVADLLVEQHQALDEAMQLYLDAIDTLDELRPRYDRDVFRAFIKIGDILKSQGDAQRALQKYEVAAGIAREAATANATSALWQRTLAESYMKIAGLLIEQGRTREALEHYQRALTFVEALAAKHPEIAAWGALVQSLKTKMDKLASKP